MNTSPYFVDAVFIEFIHSTTVIFDWKQSQTVMCDEFWI